MEIKPTTIFRTIGYICAGLFFVAGAVAALFFMIPELTNNNMTLSNVLGAVFGVLALVFAVATSLFFRALHEQKKFIDALKLENKYTIGVGEAFYNLEAFKNRARAMAKKRINHNRGQYVVAFTPTATNAFSGNTRSNIMQDLNQRIAHFLNNLFSDRNTKFPKRDHVFGFSRNVFLFYIFANNDSHVHSLINTISNECFRLVNEEKIRIWVQPFYGIYRVERGNPIVSSIENALIARSQSEKNIESFTYFRPSFIQAESAESDEILKALENNQFIPYYQAKYSLNEKRFISTEVLARWKTPEGIVGPSKFIDKAERAGLLNSIDMHIFESAVKDLGDAIKRGRRVLPVSVNFSLYEFFSKNFLPHIVEVLQKNQVPPTLLEVEITETTSQVNKFLSISVIKKLKDIGVRVLMDDFGMGYSQIENLRQIPFDAVKIDKSFTDKILDDEKSRTIVKFLIDLIHANDMEAIIEGVETKEQVDLLRKMHIDTIQGFYYSRPLNLENYNAMLKENAFEKEVKK